MFIYKTTNTINNKIYIGQTIKDDDNYLGSGKLLLKAVQKYGGKKNFKREILEHCKTRKQLNEREIFWIAFYNSTNPQIGYNIMLGGQEGGNTISNNPNIEQIKNNISKSIKEKYNNDAIYREKMMKVLSKPRSESTKLNMSLNSKGISRNKGKVVSQETKNILSIINKRIVNCQHCDKLGGFFTMQRWHFDNCKLKNNDNESVANRRA